jgi:hypothetical protein
MKRKCNDYPPYLSISGSSLQGYVNSNRNSQCINVLCEGKENECLINVLNSDRRKKEELWPLMDGWIHEVTNKKVDICVWEQQVKKKHCRTHSYGLIGVWINAHVRPAAGTPPTLSSHAPRQMWIHCLCCVVCEIYSSVYDCTLRIQSTDRIQTHRKRNPILWFDS